MSIISKNQVLSCYEFLVIEDEINSGKLLAILLRSHGAIVYLARSAQQALHLLESVRPDCIICDLMLPHMDGWEFVQRYRQLVDNPAPVIAITGGSAAAFDRERAEQAGFVDFLFKPFTNQELVRRVVHHLTCSMARG